uniref:Reverse transcriptase domain-containing protein n=1 Tax=Podarcis muralis TaxID=64176 RepID=A0A670J4I4_PODMU
MIYGKLKAVLIFVDAEKAFDNICWSFMKKNLQGMGVGQGFENGIGAIYSEQKAKIRVIRDKELQLF